MVTHLHVVVEEPLDVRRILVLIVLKLLKRGRVIRHVAARADENLRLDQACVLFLVYQRHDSGKRATGTLSTSCYLPRDAVDFPWSLEASAFSAGGNVRM